MRGLKLLLSLLLASPSWARPALSLNGTWQFRLDTGEAAEKNVDPEPGWSFPDRIQVPGCWETQGFGQPTDRMRHHGIGVGWYRRTFTLPEAWRGKRVWLRLGGVHRSVRGWVDGQAVGEHWGYPTACRWDITPALSAGPEHTLLLAVDSRRHPERDPLTGTFDLIDFVDIDWGGIFDDVTLEATGNVWIEDVFVLPEPDRNRAVAQIEWGGAVKAGRTLRYEVRRWPAGPIYAAGKTEASAPPLTLPLKLAGAPRWSPESPGLLTLRLSLQPPEDTVEVRFGLRRVEIRGNDFFLNGRRFFLRGYGDDYTLPLEIAPPTDRDYWRRYLSFRREFGFNGVRHHSMMPPEAYLAAADEVGMFVQPELPIAYQPFYDRSTEVGKDLYRQVWRDYIRQMRNHPSVFAWCMGNEFWNGLPLAPELYRMAKDLDPTRPVIDSDGIPLTDRPTLDYLSVQFNEGTLPWGSNRGKYQLSQPPPKPVLIHEMSNLSTLPDPAAADRYTGPLLPFWLETMRQRIAERRLAAFLPAMLAASHRLQARLLQLNLEAARLSPEIDGYYQWLFRDYWAQSSGFVDQFDSLRQISPAFARQFNGPAVLLWDTERVHFAAGQTIPLRLFVSDFREQDGSPWGRLQVRLGERQIRLKPPAKRTGPGLLGPWTGTAPAPATEVPLRLSLVAVAGRFRNEWPVWIFPATSPEATEADREVLVGTLSEAVVGQLEQGAAGLLLNVEGLFPTLSTTFKPAWWHGEETTDHSYGHLILPHSALGAFPHDGYGDLPMFSLLEGRPVVLLDELPGGLEPILWDLDVPWQMRRKAFLFEARVGAGKLLVSTLNLSRANRAADPAAAWLFRQLLAYVRSPDFQPVGELPADWLRERVRRWQLPDPATFVNGFARLLESTEEGQIWHSYRENDTRSFAVRQTDGRQRLVWETAPVPPDWSHDTVTFVWSGGIGWNSEPGGGHFTLAVRSAEGDWRGSVDFPFVQQTSHWETADGTIRFHYLVKRLLGPDSFGVFYLTVPRDRLRPGQPARITVTATAQNSRRWFGLNPYPDTVEYEMGY